MLVYPSNTPRLFPPPIVFCLCVQFWSVIQAFLVLVALHGDLDNHVHTLVAVQAYLVLETLHDELDNHVHTFLAVQA